MEEVSIEKIEWQAPEYTHKKRDMDFFWVIGLLTVVSAVVAIFMHNYLFAVFLIISGFCLILFTMRTPEVMTCIIERTGLTFGRDKYEWKEIKSFHIKKNEPFAKLLIHTSKHFLPVYTIPLPQDLIEKVRQSLLNMVPNVEMEESQSVLFMEKLGF